MAAPPARGRPIRDRFPSRRTGCAKDLVAARSGLFLGGGDDDRVDSDAVVIPWLVNVDHPRGACVGSNALGKSGSGLSQLVAALKLEVELNRPSGARSCRTVLRLHSPSVSQPAASGSCSSMTFWWAFSRGRLQLAVRRLTELG
jgi:hypothetical protein